MSKQLIRVGHSPDPDDAFMFYALAKNLIDTGNFQFVHELVDIETLNRRAFTGELELTFSKGPGVDLLVVRQDAEFASARGPLARGNWSGPTASAPERLRGWFGLREQILAGRNSIQTKAGRESFNLRF